MLESLTHDLAYIASGIFLLAAGLIFGIRAFKEFLRSPLDDDDWKKLGIILLTAVIAVLLGYVLLEAGFQSLIMRIEQELSELIDRIRAALGL